MIGEGLAESRGVVQSIAERRGIASVQFADDEFCFGPNKTLDVPLSRLLPPQKEMLPLKQLEVGPELCSAICAILETTPPSISHAHSSSDANNPSLGLCRLFAEMRTRACMALSSHVQQSSEFLKLFLATGCWENLQRQVTNNPGKRNRASWLEQRSKVFISCLLMIGLRLSVVESHCLSLRMLYRDCARPAAPRIEKPRSEVTVHTYTLSTCTYIFSPSAKGDNSGCNSGVASGDFMCLQPQPHLCVLSGVLSSYGQPDVCCCRTWGRSSRCITTQGSHAVC